MGVLEGSNNPFPSTLLVEQDDTAVPTPDTGQQRLFVDEADGVLKLKDPSGTVTAIDSGGSGASSSAEYIVGAADGSLSAERVRADLHANYSPDAYPAAADLADEFDDGSVNGAWGWSGTTPTHNETTYPGYMYIALTAAADPGILRRAYVPGASTAFTVVAKGSYAAYDDTGITGGWGIAVTDSSDATIGKLLWVGASAAPRWPTQRISINGSLTTVNVPEPGPPYMMIQRDASNVYRYFYSYDGITWVYVGTNTSSTAVAKVAIMNNTNVGNYHIVVDYLRCWTGSAVWKIGS
jgi:hypothetical protein